MVRGTLDSLQTDQSFRGSAHMLKMIEGIRASEVTFHVSVVLLFYVHVP